MTLLPVAIHLASLRQPLKKALHTAAQLGADGVEIDARTQIRPEDFSHTALRHFRKMLDDLNLRVAAVAFPTRRGYDVPEDLDARIDATKAAMRLAHDLGTRVVVNQIGRVPQSEETPGLGCMRQALIDLGKFGQHVGTHLAARTGSEDGPTLASFLETLPPGSVAVDFDPGRLIINGFSAHEAISVLGAYVVHVHACDGVRDLARGRGLEVTLGRGSADFPELLGALEEHAYRGFVTVERHGTDDPIGEIGQAVQYLRSLN